MIGLQNCVNEVAKIFDLNLKYRKMLPDVFLNLSGIYLELKNMYPDEMAHYEHKVLGTISCSLADISLHLEI